MFSIILLVVTNVIIISLFIAMWYYGSLSLPVALLIAAAFVVPLSFLGYRLSVIDSQVQKEALEIIIKIVRREQNEARKAQHLSEDMKLSHLIGIRDRMVEDMKNPWSVLTKENKRRLINFDRK